MFIFDANGQDPLNLSILTLPGTENVSVTLNGHPTRTTNETGIAEFSVASPGRYELSVSPYGYVDGIPLLYANDSTRVLFEKWGDLSDPVSFQESRPVEITADKNITLLVKFEHRVTIVFINQEGAKTDSGIVSSTFFQASDGRGYNLTSYESRWFSSNKFQRITIGWKVINITYTANSVVVLGRNVVQRGLHVFTPSPDSTWTIPLQVYPLRISVRDFLFGFPLDMEVRVSDLESGDTVFLTRSVSGSVVLVDVPRGDYSIGVSGGGFALSIPVILTKEMSSEIRVFSYLDAVVLGVTLISLLLMPMLLRRHPRLLNWFRGKNF